MNRDRRIRVCSAATLLAAALVVGTAAPAHADETADEQFVAAVSALGIPVKADDDVPAGGRQVCDMLTSGLTGNPNPVPVVRGVVTTLQNRGMTRRQAGGLTKAAVAIYCPQYSNYVGR